MNVQNGLICRFCGKKWFKHDIVPHEKNCRLKIVKLVDVLYQQYRIQLLYPPEIEDWPIPPKIPLIQYNNHASQHYQSTWQPCPKCGRSYPPIAIADHLNECDGENSIKQAKIPPKKAEMRGTIKPGQLVQKPGTMMETMKSIGSPTDQPIRPRPTSNSGSNDMKINNSGQQQEVEQEYPQDTSQDDRIQCARCGRKFAMNRIAAHEKICNKLKHGPPPGIDEFVKKEKTDAEWARTGFDPARYDTMGAKKAPLGQKGQKPVQKPAKKPVDPFAEQAMSDGRICCRRCGRGFAKDRIEKHEGICKGLENFVQYAPAGGSTEKAKMNMGANKSAVPSARVPISGNGGPKPAANAGQSKMAARPAPSGAQPQRSVNSAAKPVQQPMKASGAKFCHECGTSYANSVAKFCMECGEKRI